MSTFLQDFRYAYRQMLRARGLFAVAAATLALGIGANTALFSMLNTVLLQPVPGVTDARGLVWIASVNTQIGRPSRISKADFEDYRDQAPALSGAALILDQSFIVSRGGEAEQVRGQVVSPEFFAVLRMQPAAGRLITSESDTGPVAIVSHDYWQRKLGGAVAILGQTIVLNRKAYTIAGVAAEGFTGADYDEPRHIWIPLRAMTDVFPDWTTADDRSRLTFRAIARLAPGASAAQADAEVAAIAARIAAAGSKPHERLTARTYPAGAGIPPEAWRRSRRLRGSASA